MQNAHETGYNEHAVGKAYPFGRTDNRRVTVSVLNERRCSVPQVIESVDRMSGNMGGLEIAFVSGKNPLALCGFWMNRRGSLFDLKALRLNRNVDGALSW